MPESGGQRQVQVGLGPTLATDRRVILEYDFTSIFSNDIHIYVLTRQNSRFAPAVGA